MAILLHIQPEKAGKSKEKEREFTKKLKDTQVENHSEATRIHKAVGCYGGCPRVNCRGGGQKLDVGGTPFHLRI